MCIRCVRIVWCCCFFMHNHFCFENITPILFSISLFILFRLIFGFSIRSRSVGRLWVVDLVATFKLIQLFQSTFPNTAALHHNNVWQNRGFFCWTPRHLTNCVLERQIVPISLELNDFTKDILSKCQSDLLIYCNDDHHHTTNELNSRFSILVMRVLVLRLWNIIR